MREYRPAATAREELVAAAAEQEFTKWCADARTYRNKAKGRRWQRRAAAFLMDLGEGLAADDAHLDDDRDVAS